MQRYTFSSVLSRMKGHSLHEQPLSGGAGMNVLPGAAFFIWWMIPASVTTMNDCAGLSRAYLRIDEVEPMWSARRSTGVSHSGCASTSASGCSAFSRSSRRSENAT